MFPKLLRADVLGHCYSIEEINAFKKKLHHQYITLNTIFFLIGISVLGFITGNIYENTITYQDFFFSLLALICSYYTANFFLQRIDYNLNSLQFITPATYSSFIIRLSRVSKQPEIQSYLKRVFVQERQLTLLEYRAILRHYAPYDDGAEPTYAASILEELRQELIS